MAIKGWGRIGIVLSVIWFLGFGVFLFAHPTLEAELHGRRLQNCYLIYGGSIEEEDARKYASDADDMIRHWMPDIEARRKECETKASLWYDNNKQSNYARLAEIVALNLLSIALAWLVAWGCIAVGRWVHRGFANP